MLRKEPKVYRLEEYEVPDYFVHHTELQIDLSQDPVQAQAKLTLRPNLDSEKRGRSLTLNGENMQLVSLYLNGKLLTEEDYELTESELIIKNVPEEAFFTLESKTLLGNNPD